MDLWDAFLPFKNLHEAAMTGLKQAKRTHFDRHKRTLLSRGPP